MPVVKHAEIRASRQRLGIKLGEFAERVGVKYKTLANIECGTQKFVSIEVVYRIAQGLGRDAEDLLAEEAGEDGACQAKGAAAA